MVRLPQPGGDSGSWGSILNEYLSVSHKNDGTLKVNSVNTAAIQDGAVTLEKLATSSAPTMGQVLSYSGADLTWSTISGSGSVPDADDSTKGLVQLAGDLGGTAASPTVPGLVNKEPVITAGTTAQYYRGDKSWQTLDKAAVGLSNVDNTSDASKPISSATQTALNGKANTTHTHAATDITSGTLSSSVLPAASEAAAGIVELATTTEAATGTDTARAVTPAGLAAGLQTVTKSSLGLGNVDNTSDANKPISTATQTALDGKVTLDGTSQSLSLWLGTQAEYDSIVSKDNSTVYIIKD